MRAHTLDLQRNEGFINVAHMVFRHGVAKLRGPTRAHIGILAQGFDVLPLAQAHGSAGLFQAELKPIGLRKSVYKNLSGGKRAEVHHGAGPVKDDGFKLELWCGVRSHKRP